MTPHLAWDGVIVSAGSCDLSIAHMDLRNSPLLSGIAQSQGCLYLPSTD